MYTHPKTEVASENYKQYSPERLKRAINAVKNGNSSYKAAKEFNIHTSVIRRNLRNGNTNFPTRVLNNEEQQSLVTYIEYCYQRNFPLTRKMIKMFVRQIMKKMGREIPNQKGPSNKWYRSFLKRHKDLSMKKPQIIDGGRQRMANLTVMKEHFDLLEETLKRLCIFDKGQFIFNMDETGFGKSTVIDKVCTPKSSHSYTKMVTTSQHTTAVVCTSADGNVLPTMVIYEKSFPSGAYRRGIPEAWLFARSPNGYVDSELFIQWFKEIFLNSTSHLSQHNILLTMDNHESHLSIELIDLAIARNVDLFCLPPHTTHILQPLDVGCFKPLKKEFAQVLSTAVDKALSPYIVKNAFRKCGILPFNREAIDRKKLAPLDKSYKGSTSDHTDTDPLCHSCGQFVYGHPLVKEGLIPQDLADIFVPIIGKAKKQLNTRVVTVARVITGLEWRKQLEDKEEKNTKKTKRQPRQNSKTSVNKQKSKKKSKKPVEKLTPEVEISECGDDLPELSRPKPKQKRKRKVII
ncbi:unnamed protein product [Mytilus edulis]|uniref:HTH CENPB-type domain-containing protein n=1 Tax=Mytilus edulis TaxID=6550 RepID=A0A8S3S3F7_MYTED|nr:unnamed protein product [Mytilus edulis]